MKTVRVKDVVFNEGQPKICVPIVGKTKEDVLGEVKYLNSVDFDLVEFRVDFYEYVEDFTKVKELLGEIRAIYNKPLLFTFRTKREGGHHAMSEEKYSDLNHAAIESGLIDMIDVELFTDKKNIEKLIPLAKENNVKVIMSNHDFHKTSPKDEIVSRLVTMQEYDADITKIAVMPNTEEDVLILLDGSLEMKKGKADRPFMAISMGSLGVISRLSGELFGSCITFAAVRENSALGQLKAGDVKVFLNRLSNYK